MKNFFKGFVIGIGKIIPGVSGAVLAIIMGIYDKSLYYLSNFRENKKESIKYLFPIVMGIMIAIIVFSKIINYALNKFYLMTMLFFIGLIIGGIPFIARKVKRKDYYITIIVLIIFLGISITNISNTYVWKNNLFDMVVFGLSGLVEAIGTVVPGISSTALLMIMGTYNTVISSLGNITNFSNIIINLKILIPFTFGIIIGIIEIVKIVNILFQKYEKKMYSFILGVLLSSVLLLIIQAFQKEFTTMEFIYGIILLFLGIFIGYSMEEK